MQVFDTHNYIHIFWFSQSEYGSIQISTKIKSALQQNVHPEVHSLNILFCLNPHTDWHAHTTVLSDRKLVLFKATHRLTWQLFFQTESLFCWKNTQTDMNTWLYSEIIHQQTTHNHTYCHCVDYCETGMFSSILLVMTSFVSHSRTDILLVVLKAFICWPSS